MPTTASGGHHGGGRGHHEVIEPVGWMDRPESVKRFFTVFYVICGALLLADVLLLGAENAHPHPLEERMRFVVYPVYGFVSFWFLVLVARPMRSLLIRSEDYYEGGGAYDEPGARAGGHGTPAGDPSDASAGGQAAQAGRHGASEGESQAGGGEDG